MRHYTGVGSRNTPVHIQRQMVRYAMKLAKMGYILRSGAADGADHAFEVGCNHVGGKKEIFIPWHGFNSRQSGAVGTFSLDDYPIFTIEAAIAFTKRIHPAWERLSRGGKKLHCRNVFQVLGHNLKSPSRFLVCWTPGGRITGGTATAIKLASLSGIPVFNLGAYRGGSALEEYLKEEGL